MALVSLIEALHSLESSGGTKIWEYLKAEREEKSVTGVKTGNLSILRQLRVRREKKPSPHGPKGKEPRGEKRQGYGCQGDVHVPRKASLKSGS